MLRKFLGLVLCGMLLVSTSCRSRNFGPAAMSLESGGGGLVTGNTYADASPIHRYIAERHEFEIVTTESELPKSWESVVAFCGTIRCEVMSSSLTAGAGNLFPSASASLRVAPQDLTKLFDQIQKSGKVAKHTTDREDKTTEVVDTEAKVKNLTAFRDNLRAMLAKPSASVKDLVEIQKQLTDTQSDLDSEIANQKILANETEKIFVRLSFSVNVPRGSARGLSLIWDALLESGSDLAGSTAFLITVIVSVIPWLIIVGIPLWFLVRTWRKRRRNRPVRPLPPQATP